MKTWNIVTVCTVQKKEDAIKEIKQKVWSQNRIQKKKVGVGGGGGGGGRNGEILETNCRKNLAALPQFS